MSNNNGKITKPISVTADVAKVLGEPSRDIGILCQSSKINKWAKYKPIYHTGWTMNDAEREDIIPYQGHTLSNGMIVPRYQGVLAFKAAMDAADGEHYYTYVHPPGTPQYPCRIFDFVSSEDSSAGYEHNAKPPYAGVVGSRSTSYYTISFLNNIQTGGQVKLIDLNPDGDIERTLGSYYLGVMIVDKATDTFVGPYVNQLPFEAQATIAVERKYLSNGRTYIMYPFLCSTNNTTEEMWMVPIEGVGGWEYTEGRDYVLTAKASWVNPFIMTTAKLTYSVVSYRDNLNKTLLLELIDASTGVRIPGKYEEVQLSLNTNDRYPEEGNAVWRVAKPSDVSNAYFRMTIDNYHEDISIISIQDNGIVPSEPEA